MSDGTDDAWDNYESGPFCRHWGDPSDCDELCLTCNHRCVDHGFSDSECNECDCGGWKEGEEATK
jgi:hypothetical protein